LEPRTTVTLDLLVTDKANQPVAGLEPFDFSISDNNTAQKLMGFSREDVSPGHPDGSVEVIYVLDSVNSEFNDMLYERADFGKFLRRNGGKLAQPTTIVLLDDGEMKVQPRPSRDGNALADSLEKSPTPVHNWASAEGYAGLVQRSQFCLKSLAELTFYERTKPGRKMMIWLGNGWPSLARGDAHLNDKQFQGIFDSIALLTNRFREARITLYNVIVRTEVVQSTPLYYKEYLKFPAKPVQAQSPDLLLQTLAVHSGGRIVDIDRNLSREIDSCLGDLSAWYTITYNPTPVPKPDELHLLGVKTSKEGLTVRTTEGYYGQP
jgi:VWFA-related protein